jgi:hypothetical protein
MTRTAEKDVTDGIVPVDEYGETTTTMVKTTTMMTTKISW